MACNCCLIILRMKSFFHFFTSLSDAAISDRRYLKSALTAGQLALKLRYCSMKGRILQALVGIQHSAKY